MDRLAWYQPGESMEEIICQSGHVGIYDGESKQDCRLILHHSLVEKIEKQHKTMFGKGGKIIVYVKPVPIGHQRGPVAASGSNMFRFVFRSGGEDEFYKNYVEALNRQMWKRTSSSSSSTGSRTTATNAPRNVGILGIERRLAERHQQTQERISEAFEDMSRLMTEAGSLVNLAKNITERIRSGKGGDITDDETVKFRTTLMSLGVSDPVTKKTFASNAVYFEKLANELTEVLYEPISKCGGTMTLAEAYCRLNRARGFDLISPDDLVNACEKLEQIGSSLCLYKFESGLKVIQLCSLNQDTVTDELLALVEQMGFIDVYTYAKIQDISEALAKERLLAAESMAKLCRDESIEGCFFYPNKFFQMCGGDSSNGIGGDQRKTVEVGN